jgi:outer membrane receptor protein involved in Fe transport
LTGLFCIISIKAVLELKMCKSIFSNVFIILFFLFIDNVSAQQTGKITGRITDSQTDEPIAGANILLADTKLGASSDLEGEFYIINVEPGTYIVEAQMMGYGTVRKEGIRVSVNRTVYVDFQLNPELLESEVIVITAEKSAIKKDQTSSIRNISSDEIEALPVESISQIVQLQPGVVGSHFRGGRSNEGSYMIDGVLVTESFYHQQAMVEVTPQVVEDMEVITGTFNAEYGNAMSGVVNIVTKEGTSKLEGFASINLGNYLTTHKDKFVGLEDSDIRIEDYTFSLSGPLIKDRLNFILDSRYLSNKGYLRAIHRFNVDDYSDFREYPARYISEANGDGSYVDVDDNEKLFLLGKLNFKPAVFLKTSLTYTFNKSEFQNYNHALRYNPFGMATSHNSSNMVAFHVNHTLSKSAFYEFILSYNKYKNGQYLYKDPEDLRYVHDFYGNASGAWFSTGGQSKNHTQRTEEKFGIKFDLTWQLDKRHSLKSGIDFTQIMLDQKYSNIRNKYEGTDLEALYEVDSLTNKRRYLYYEPEVRSAETIFSDFYEKEPIQFAAYVQDKMEFESMVVNLGLRYDYFDPNTVYPTNWRNPANQDFFEDESRISKYPDVEPFDWLSPRLGLSYKVGDAALLRFSYGHFLQIPPLNYYYQNSNFRVSELGLIGNPLLKPQKTISYEVGLWLQLTREMDFEVAVFYRDIYDLLSSRIVYTYSQIRYGLFDNKDYGNVRGLEIQYQARFGKFSVNTNYTLQYTRGVADSPEYAFNRAGQDQDPVNKLIPLEWDQRHTLNIITSYSAQKYALSFLGTYSSGRPYSWVPITESPLALLNLLPNNEVRPSKFTLDLRAHYNLIKLRGVDIKLTLLAYNILDLLNENNVNSTTGRAYTGIVRPIDEETYRSDFSEFIDIYQNPDMFAVPRSIKLGLGFQF